MENLYLLAGLGNPGKKYVGTRHNLGFTLLDAFAEKNQMAFEKHKRFDGEVAAAKFDEINLHLLKPHTYMNLSGEAVSRYLNYYKMEISHLLVISDDSDIPFGTLRIREKGGAGGHKGLKNIEDHLGTKEYARLRIGIGRPERGELEDFVLTRFSGREEELLPTIVANGVQILQIWLRDGFAKAAAFIGSLEQEEKIVLE